MAQFQSIETGWKNYKISPLLRAGRLAGVRAANSVKVHILTAYPYSGIDRHPVLRFDMYIQTRTTNMNSSTN